MFVVLVLVLVLSKPSSAIERTCSWIGLAQVGFPFLYVGPIRVLYKAEKTGKAVRTINTILGLRGSYWPNSFHPSTAGPGFRAFIWWDQPSTTCSTAYFFLIAFFIF